jgi:hypothetical protein
MSKRKGGLGAEEERLLRDFARRVLWGLHFALALDQKADDQTIETCGQMVERTLDMVRAKEIERRATDSLKIPIHPALEEALRRLG